MIFGSFFITEKFTKRDVEELKELTEHEMRKVVADRLADAKVDIEDSIEIAVDNAVETIDTKTDKETNQKIMEISEFSDTVLEAMSKSHNEVMFMYSMLNDKHHNIVEMETRLEKLKSEVKQIDESVAKKYADLSEKEAELLKKAAELEQKEKLLEIERAAQLEAQQTLEAQLQAKYEEQQAQESKNLQDSLTTDDDASNDANAESGVDPVAQFIQGINEKNSKKGELPVAAVFENDIPGPEDNVKENKNKQILEMHDIGMSEIDIAKKLGVGLGEVKFVLGLYQEK